MAQFDSDVDVKTRHPLSWFMFGCLVFFGFVRLVIAFVQPATELSLTGTFEAFAHIAWGFIFGAWVCTWKSVNHSRYRENGMRSDAWKCFLALIVVELVAIGLTKYLH